MEIPEIDVATIVEGLKVRQKLQRPTLLFLGARTGALYNSDTFYKTLARLSNRPFDTLDQVEKFQLCIRLLEEPKRFSKMDIHYILLGSLQKTLLQPTDQYVATLAKQHFFQLIVTTNIDTGLDVALDQNGLSVRDKHFDVVIPKPGSSVPSLGINDANKGERLFRLVKFYGELRRSQEKEVSLEDATEHYYNPKHRGRGFTQNLPLYRELRNMRNWNILMVGFDSAWDAAILRFLFPCAGRLWFVNEKMPPQDSEVYKYLQGGTVPCLLGMNSQNFFQSLYQHLIGSAPLSRVEVPADPSPTELDLLAPTERKRRDAVPANRTKSLPPIQHQVDVLLIVANEHKIISLLESHVVTIKPHTTRNGRTYHDLGKIGDANVSLVQAKNTEDGSDTLSKQIQELSPACVIVLGMAWGFKCKGQEIGNILVPDRIFVHAIKEDTSYDSSPLEAGTDAYLSQRRNRTEPIVSRQLFNEFKSGSITLSRRPTLAVKFGSLLSSTDIIEPEAVLHYVNKKRLNIIGIEKGDSDLLSLAYKHQKNCILVKGISTLIDEDDITHENPRRVLNNVIHFVLQVIALGGFHNPLHNNILSQ